MDVLFFLLFIISTIALIIGIIKPKLVIMWGNKEKRNRKNVFKVYGLSMVVFMVLFITSISSSNDKNIVENNEDNNKKEVEEKTEVVNNEKTPERKEYGLNEWWQVDDQWRLKIDSVFFTDERNEYSEQKPEAVVVVKYTYENLGYEGDVQDLFMTPNNVIDGNGKVSSSYPAGAEVHAKETPVGAITEGAEESYGITSTEGELSIHFDEYDTDSNKQKAIFVIPLPSK